MIPLIITAALIPAAVLAAIILEPHMVMGDTKTPPRGTQEHDERGSMTVTRDFAYLVQSLRRSMWRQSGRFHRTLLLTTGQYIKTSRRTRP